MRDPVTYPVVWPDFQWADETGDMELIVAECTMAARSRPEKVTAILCACLATIDGQRVTEALARRLSVGTREWLLQQVAASCRPAEDWHEVRCTECGAHFDLSLDLAALPKSPAPEGFPQVVLETTSGGVTFEIPNGAQEETLARTPRMGPKEFLLLCALEPDAPPRIAALPEAELTRLEDALDAATPETADTVATQCPDCDSAQQIRIDPLTYAFPQAARVLHDVHMLSSAYNWSETAILTLPTARRQTYVSMVSAARGQP